MSIAEAIYWIYKVVTCDWNYGYLQYVHNFLAQILTIDNLHIKNLNFVVIFSHKVARAPPDSIYDYCHDGIDHLHVIQLAQFRK